MVIRRACVCVFYGVWHGEIDHMHYPKKQRPALIKASDVAEGSIVLIKQRPQVLGEVEKLLLLFVNDKPFSGDNLSEDAI